MYILAQTAEGQQELQFSERGTYNTKDSGVEITKGLSGRQEDIMKYV